MKAEAGENSLQEREGRNEEENRFKIDKSKMEYESNGKKKVENENKWNGKKNWISESQSNRNDQYNLVVQARRQESLFSTLELIVVYAVF